jgi:hypothetical protein
MLQHVGHSRPPIGRRRGIFRTPKQTALTHRMHSHNLPMTDLMIQQMGQTGGPNELDAINQAFTRRLAEIRRAIQQLGDSSFSTSFIQILDGPDSIPDIIGELNGKNRELKSGLLTESLSEFEVDRLRLQIDNIKLQWGEFKLRLAKTSLTNAQEASVLQSFGASPATPQEGDATGKIACPEAAIKWCLTSGGYALETARTGISARIKSYSEEH